MNTVLRFCIYITVVTLATASAWRRFKRLERPFKIIAVLLLYTMIHELVAAWMGQKYGNNMPAWHLYTIVNIILVSWYYNEAVPVFKKYHVGWYVGAAGALASVVNSLYLQPLDILNSHAILFSCDCIVAMTLYAFYRIYIYNGLRYVGKDPHFWMALAFLFFWCITFLIIASFQPFLVMKWTEMLKVSYWVLWIANVIYYAGIAVIFLRFTSKKKIYVN